ncbi:MAG: UvrD-helicase domain-containing protein [Planctomycetota bacterium]
MSAPHSLLLASAGTGKTYRLATHFAALLAAGVEPSRVLATTFTRKAAGEILDRVLARLVEAATVGEKGEGARASLASAAERVYGEPQRLTREAALERLAGLARQVGRFQVRTLDSFFIQVARLFAYELALMPEWHIADDIEDDALRAEILSEVIAALGPNERVALLQAIAQVGAPTASHSVLIEAVHEALELHREARPGQRAEAWAVIEPSAPPDAAELDAAVRHLMTFELPLTKAGKPNGNWEKLRAKTNPMLEQRDWGAWFDGALATSVRSGKLSYHNVAVPDSVAEAARVVDREALADVTARLVAMNVATGNLCDLYLARERAAKDRTGAYRFEDFPRALGAGPAGADDEEGRALWLADLGYRLDTRVSHLLLDEFQDTAPLQWRLLMPLAEELLAGHDEDGQPRTFFCVGDVKQSIYGWREAEPRLLGEMHQRHPVLVPEAMTESWRSSDVVLDTVNQLFAKLPEREVFAGDEREVLRARAADWSAGFTTHRRAGGAGPCAGAARLLEVAVTEREGGKLSAGEASVAVTVERVAQLVERVPEATVAILLRSKKDIPRLLFGLRERGIDASGEGGNPLTDAALVTQALALLHLADHPDDGVAALSVVHSPFAARYGLEGARVDGRAERTRLRAVSRAVRRELVEVGYGVFLERLARACAADASDWDQTRFAQLVELALAYDARAGLRPTSFAQLVRRQRVESPTGARVKVMTVHASKGLEFDAVFLPQLTGSLTGQRSTLLSWKRGPLEPIDVLSRAPKKEVMALRPDLRQLADQVDARTLIDELSVLYVATTRAVHHLELIVPTSAKTRPAAAPVRVMELVREGLVGESWGARSTDADAAGDATEPDPGYRVRELWRHADSDETWRPAPAKRDTPTGPAPLAPRALTLAPAAAPRQVRYRTPSGAEARRMDAASLLAPPERRARDLGTLVHKLFEGVEWSEDEARGEVELRAALRRQATDTTLIEEALARFQAALARADVRAALSREALQLGPDERAEVLAERSFDVDLSEGEATAAWRGAIDRLVLVRSGDRVVRAEVLDFKTDAVDAATVAAHAARYQPQLEAYRRVVAELYALSPESVRATLLFVTAGLRV